MTLDNEFSLGILQVILLIPTVLESLDSTQVDLSPEHKSVLEREPESKVVDQLIDSFKV